MNALAMAGMSTVEVLKLAKAALEKDQQSEIDDFEACIRRLANAYKEANKPTQKVYVMQDGNKFKIGRAADPEQRLRQLKGVSGRPNLSLVLVSPPMPRAAAAKLERALHKRFECTSEWAKNINTKEVDDFMKGYN